MSTEVNKTHVNMYSVRKGETMVPVITLPDKDPFPFNVLARKIARLPALIIKYFLLVFRVQGRVPRLLPH